MKLSWRHWGALQLLVAGSVVYGKHAHSLPLWAVVLCSAAIGFLSVACSVRAALDGGE
jgi:hypothetical protein